MVNSQLVVRTQLKGLSDKSDDSKVSRIDSDRLSSAMLTAGYQ